MLLKGNMPLPDRVNISYLNSIESLISMTSLMQVDCLDEITQGYAFVLLGRLEDARPGSEKSWAGCVQKIDTLQSHTRRLMGVIDRRGYDGKNRDLLQYMAEGIDDLATHEGLDYFTQQHNELQIALDERVECEHPDQFKTRKLRHQHCAFDQPLHVWGLASWLAGGEPEAPKYDAALHLSFYSVWLRENNPQTDELLRNPKERYQPPLHKFYLFFENLDSS